MTRSTPVRFESSRTPKRQLRRWNVRERKLCCKVRLSIEGLEICNAQWRGLGSIDVNSGSRKGLGKFHVLMVNTGSWNFS